MKSPSRELFLGHALSLFFAFSLVALAQEPAKPEEKTPPPASAATPVAAVPATPPADATPATPEAAPAPAVAEAEKKTPVSSEESKLRRLDRPESSDETRTETRPRNRRNRGGGSGDFPMGDHTLAKGNFSHEVVSIFGSSRVEGEVGSGAVSVFGDTTVGPDAIVGGEAVAILGELVVNGRVRGEAVSVLGGVYVDGPVGGEVVSVLGPLELGPNAVVEGDLVVVGGTFTADPKAIVHGNRVTVPFLGHWGGANGLAAWFRHCLKWGRPLAFVPGIGFAWALAIGFLALYVMIALVFRGGVDKCVTTLETRPGSSILTAILSSLLTPVAVVLLCVTVIGIVAVPFLLLGLVVAGLVGKTVMLAWVGRRITKFFGDGPLSHTAFAVLVGGVIVLFLYCVPAIGMLVQKSFELLGFGVVVYTLLLANKREKTPPPPRAPGAPAPMPTPMSTPPSAPVPSPMPAPTSSLRLAPLAPLVPPSVAAPSAMPLSSPGFGATGIVAGEPAAAGPDASATAPGTAALAPGNLPPAGADVPPAMPAPVAPPPMISAATSQRAGFMIRLWALLLDVVLIAITTGFIFHKGEIFPLLVAAYGAVMWKLKGTTVGGVICGLKVVRIDGREIDWATAIVRALGCFLSLAVAGLGFLWVAIDDDKQSWHDKIAGTTVVRVPKGVSLI